MINSKRAARLRFKRKQGKLGDKEAGLLAEYEAAKAEGKLSASLDPQPEGESPPGGTDPNPNGTPDPVPDKDGGSVPVEPLQAPPPVAEVVVRHEGVRWQDKYRPKGGQQLADGREEACCFFADAWIEAMQALEAELKLIGKEPLIPAAKLRNVAILAADQLLPDRVRMSPPVTVVVGTTATAIQRIKNHKEIVAAQKNDPSVQEYKRKVAAQKEQANQPQPGDPPPVVTSPPAPPKEPKFAAPVPPPPPKIDDLPSAKGEGDSYQSPAAADGRMFA